MNLHKVGWFRFYIIMSILGAAKRLRRVYFGMKHKAFGLWYCDGCKTYHSRRTVAYFPCELSDGICYKHIEPQEVKKYESVFLGSKNITAWVKREFREKEGGENEV